MKFHHFKKLRHVQQSVLDARDLQGMRNDEWKSRHGLITTQAFFRFRQWPLSIVCIYKNHVTVKSSCQLYHLTNNSGTLKILS